MSSNKGPVIAVHPPAARLTVYFRDGGDALVLPSVVRYATENGLLKTTTWINVRGNLVEVDGAHVQLADVHYFEFDHSATAAAIEQGIDEGTRRLRDEYGITDYVPQVPQSFLRRERADGAAPAPVLCVPHVTVNNQIEAVPGEVTVNANVPDREITLLENADGEISGASVKSK